MWTDKIDASMNLMPQNRRLSGFSSQGYITKYLTDCCRPGVPFLKRHLKRPMNLVSHDKIMPVETRSI